MMMSECRCAIRFDPLADIEIAHDILGSVETASCLAYRPASRNLARGLLDAIKSGDARCIKHCVERLRELSRRAPLDGYFDPSCLLIPVPGRARTADGKLWVAKQIAMAMAQAGLGGEIWCGLQRAVRVAKSGTASPGRRPTVPTLYGSFSIQAAPEDAHSVLLVDDVVTRGRTLLAAAARVREAMPAARVKAFALMRTVWPGAYSLPLEPWRGEIRWGRGDARRLNSLPTQ